MNQWRISARKQEQSYLLISIIPIFPRDAGVQFREAAFEGLGGDVADELGLIPVGEAPELVGEGHDDGGAGGHFGNVRTGEDVLGEVVQAGIVAEEHDVVPAFLEATHDFEDAVGFGEVEAGFEQQLLDWHGEGLAHDLRGAQGAQGGAGDEAVRQREQGRGAVAAEVRAMQERRDGGCGALASLIERTIMVGESRLAPAGFRVTHDGEVFHEKMTNDV